MIRSQNTSKTQPIDPGQTPGVMDGFVYSGSYMGFSAPPELDPCSLTPRQRKWAKILRSVGAEGQWKFLGEDEWVIVSNRRRLMHCCGHEFTSAQSSRYWHDAPGDDL